MSTAEGIDWQGRSRFDEIAAISAENRRMRELQRAARKAKREEEKQGRAEKQV